MNASGNGEAWARLTAIDYHNGDLRLLAGGRLNREPAGCPTSRRGAGGTELQVHARIMTGGQRQASRKFMAQAD